MSVTSKPLTSERKARATGAGFVSIVGTALLLISTGPLFILLNGGYSIVGMAWLSEHTGEYGRLFWELATTWTVDIPIAARAGLPLAQPIIPWCMVLGISFLEIGLLIRRFYRGKPDPLLDTLGGVAAIFDYATTSIGLIFAPLAAGAILFVRILWGALAVALAVPLTFGFEALVARLLAELQPKRRET